MESNKKWLETPDGWGRATILFQVLREPPEVGSLRESLLLAYVYRQQEIEYLSRLALAQLIVDKENDKHFKSLRNAMFPWIEQTAKRDQDAHIKALTDEIKRGPMSVRAVDSPRVQSRLVKRLAKAPHTNENPLAHYRVPNVGSWSRR